MTHATSPKWTNDEVTNVPYRTWYSIAETAVLTGMSETFIRDGVQKSRRANPPADAIPFRKFGSQIRIPRTYIYPDEPPNVTHLHGGLTDAQLDAALDRLIGRLFGIDRRITA